MEYIDEFVTDFDLECVELLIESLEDKENPRTIKEGVTLIFEQNKYDHMTVLDVVNIGCDKGYWIFEKTKGKKHTIKDTVRHIMRQMHLDNVLMKNKMGNEIIYKKVK